jgi:hypothetical protein
MYSFSLLSTGVSKTTISRVPQMPAIMLVSRRTSAFFIRTVLLRAGLSVCHGPSEDW